MDRVNNSVCAVVFLVGDLIKADYKDAGHRQQEKKPGIVNTKLGGEVDTFVETDANNTAEKTGADGYVYPFYKAAACLQHIFCLLLRKMHVHVNTPQ